MPIPREEKFLEDKRRQEFRSFVRAQIALMQKSGDAIVEEYRYSLAKAILLSGLTVIPSHHLMDHQIVISEGVYNKVKELLKKI